jgi:hypothetical protein
LRKDRQDRQGPDLYEPSSGDFLMKIHSIRNAEDIGRNSIYRDKFDIVGYLEGERCGQKAGVSKARQVDI